MEKIRSAVIGCGRMGAFTSEKVKKYSPKSWLPLSHIEALICCPDTFLESICDIDKDLLDKTSSQYGIENIFYDYQIMLEEIKPELLCVATRTIERTAIISDAINTGVKAIHLEKPICNSIKQLNELDKIVKEKNIVLTYGTIRRYFNIYNKAKEIANSGEVGILQEIEINFGSAQLFWTHPHSVDTILYFAGLRNISHVEANLDNVVFGDKDDFVTSDPLVHSAKIFFDDGCIGKITTRPGMDVTLYCSQGIIVVEGDGKRLIVRKINKSDAYFEYPGKSFTKEDNTPEGSMAAIQSLVGQLRPNAKINNKYDSFFDKDHIFNGQRVLFGLIQSHIDGGLPVYIDEIRPSINVLGKTDQFYA